MPYAKLHSSILQSTVWLEDHETFRVWIALMAMADSEGCVQASIPGLAHTCLVTVEQCEQAIAKFLAPDHHSRTQDHDGRRVEEIQGGWRLLNYRFHRDRNDAETRREYERERKRAYREKQGALDVPDKSRPVPPCPDQSRKAEAEAKAEPGSSGTKAPQKRKNKDPRTEPPDVAEVLDAIIEERRRSGVPNARRTVPAPADTIKVVKARLAEVGLERVLRVVRRKGTDCLIDGCETPTVRFLTAQSLMRPANFARLDEADELDDGIQADDDRAIEFRMEQEGDRNVLMARTPFGWREATELERAAHAEGP